MILPCIIDYFTMWLLIRHHILAAIDYFILLCEIIYSTILCVIEHSALAHNQLFHIDYSTILPLNRLLNIFCAYNRLFPCILFWSLLYHHCIMSLQAQPGKTTKVNADQGDPNYPVMFNIFLWFGIAFFMTLLATSCEFFIFNNNYFFNKVFDYYNLLVIH